MTRHNAPRGRKRVTIADIAARAGVTSGAVSRAINGKPGVSDATRERILRVARELNWRPSHAAQALMGKNAEAVGLVLARPAEVIGEESFFAKFIAGVQSALSAAGYSLLLQMASDTDAEIALQRGWVADGRVDGILVLDPRVGDSRIRALAGLDIPAVIVGGDLDEGQIRSVHTDNALGMTLVTKHLSDLGHRRVAFISGDQTFHHTQQRIQAFGRLAIDLGIWGQTIAGDFDATSAGAATMRLLTAPQPPTAIIYDSDVMALAGMRVIAQLGLTIPGDVSVVSWEDSTTCQVLHPTLTALNRDAVALGRLAATSMLHLLATDPTPIDEVSMRVVTRESTAEPTRCAPAHPLRPPSSPRTP